MKNKNDMYIDYSRSYKRRGRRRGSNSIKAVLVIIIILGIGLGAYYAIRIQMHKIAQERNQEMNDTELKVGQADGEELLMIDVSEGQLKTSEKDMSSEIVTQSDLNQEDTAEQEQDTGNQQELVDEQDVRMPVKVKGIYVTGSAAGTGLKNNLIDIVDTTEINAMVIDVKNDEGRITYSMDSGMAKEIGATSNIISDMESLMKTLKEKNIYLIARVVAFKDPYLAKHRKDLALLNRNGTYYTDNKGEYWVNPYKKEVWDYLIDVATQAAAIGFHEIQFDYIRFSTGGSISKVDYGEEEKTGTKEEIILEFTKYACEQLKPLGVFVSADVYGTIISSNIDAGLVGQNYVEMSRYLDYICPMIYPSHYGNGNYGVEYPDLEPFKVISKALAASRSKLEEIPEGEHRAIVRPWLQDFTATWLRHHMKYGGPEVRAQIDGVYEAHYEEWLLWNASCKYTVEGLLKE